MLLDYWPYILVTAAVAPTLALIVFGLWIRKSDSLNSDLKIKAWEAFAKIVSTLLVISGGLFAFFVYVEEQRHSKAIDAAARQDALKRETHRVAENRRQQLLSIKLNDLQSLERELDESQKFVDTAVLASKIAEHEDLVMLTKQSGFVFLSDSQKIDLLISEFEEIFQSNVRWTKDSVFLEATEEFRIKLDKLRELDSSIGNDFTSAEPNKAFASMKSDMIKAAANLRKKADINYKDAHSRVTSLRREIDFDKAIK